MLSKSTAKESGWLALAPITIVQGWINIAGSVFTAAGRPDRLFFGSLIVFVVLLSSFGQMGIAGVGPVMLLNSISLIIDTIDVLRYARGERAPIVTPPK